MEILLPNIDFQKNQSIANTTSKMDASEVFSKSYFPYVDKYKLFMAHFNEIPNFTCSTDIDGIKANNWLVSEFQKEIKDLHYYKTYYYATKKSEFHTLFYFLFEDLMIEIDIDDSMVRFLFKKTDLNKIETLIKNINKFRKRKTKKKPLISLLTLTKSGLETKSLKIIRPKLKIEDNYNDDFLDVHKTILKRLSKKNDKGLVLLHGKPGTGKTSYIRYLISSLKKEIIFLPPNMASVITNPDLISLLIDKPNSIFVIEDAENIVIDRQIDGDSKVSALLNISDGLLSDCLNIQIICSFNTDISKIDTALMRKGRMIASYDFKELEVPKVQALSKKLGFNSILNSPMTLTAIYNQSEQDFQHKRKANQIGFKTFQADGN